MILKSLTRRSGTAQLLGYLFKQEKVEQPEPILKHNIRSKSISGWVKELESNHALRIHRRIDNIILYHTILSFSDKDKVHITSELLKDIAKRFVDLRGKDNIFLAASHHDKDHIHMHIVMSATKYMTGESNRISKKEFHELKIALDRYQKERYPMLVHSLPEHGKAPKNLLTEKEFQLQARRGVPSLKQQVLQAVEAVYNQSQSRDHFLSLLQSEGLEPYYRGGKLYGIENDNRRYRFKTMGYSSDKLDQLDQLHEKEAFELQKLRDLRESKITEKEVEDERSPDNNGQEETEVDSQDIEYDDLEV